MFNSDNVPTTFNIFEYVLANIVFKIVHFFKVSILASEYKIHIFNVLFQNLNRLLRQQEER